MRILTNISVLTLLISVLACSAYGDLMIHYEVEALPAVDSIGTTVANVQGSDPALSTDVPTGTGSTNSLSFGGEGSGYLDLRNAADPARPLIDIGNYDATIAFWIKADAAQNVSYAHVFTDRAAYTNYRFLASRSKDTASLSIHIRNGLVPSITISNVFDDQWHHIAVVIDQTNNGAEDGSQGIKVYKDGVLYASRDVVVPWFNLQKETTVGSDNLEKTKILNGKLDDLRIYTTKLTSEQIQNLIVYSPFNTDCSSSDINKSLEVDIDDLMLLAENWLVHIE
jgi:hypothetical protein